MYFDRDSYQKSVRRAREERWRVRGRARVVHPKYGAVVVPHRSNYSALLNAAEYWGCEWADIRDAEVWAVPPGTAVVIPKEFCGRNRKSLEKTRSSLAAAIWKEPPPESGMARSEGIRREQKL